VRAVLRKAGCAVITIDSPLGAAQAVALAPPRLVILDFMMPGLDGATLCRSIKENPATAQTTVWLYSSVSDEHLAQLAQDAGAEGYLRKGARLTDVAEQVAAFLGLPART
jgi:CheY-like chemotaxis protein